MEPLQNAEAYELARLRDEVDHRWAMFDPKRFRLRPSQAIAIDDLQPRRRPTPAYDGGDFVRVFNLASLGSCNLAMEGHHVMLPQQPRPRDMLMHHVQWSHAREIPDRSLRCYDLVPYVAMAKNYGFSKLDYINLFTTHIARIEGKAAKSWIKSHTTIFDSPKHMTAVWTANFQAYIDTSSITSVAKYDALSKTGSFRNQYPSSANTYMFFHRVGFNTYHTTKTMPYLQHGPALSAPRGHDAPEPLDGLDHIHPDNVHVRRINADSVFDDSGFYHTHLVGPANAAGVYTCTSGMCIHEPDNGRLASVVKSLLAGGHARVMSERDDPNLHALRALTTRELLDWRPPCTASSCRVGIAVYKYTIANHVDGTLDPLRFYPKEVVLLRVLTPTFDSCCSEYWSMRRESFAPVGSKGAPQAHTVLHQCITTLGRMSAMDERSPGAVGFVNMHVFKNPHIVALAYLNYVYHLLLRLRPAAPPHELLMHILSFVGAYEFGCVMPPLTAVAPRDFSDCNCNAHFCQSP